MTVEARRSASRKYVICGACGKSLCRIERRTMPGGPPVEVDGRRVPGHVVQHVLAWGDAWHVVDDHIEMRESALERLLDGHKPGRKDWANEERFDLSEAVRRAAPARCHECGEINAIKWKRLDVDGVASY